MEMEGSENTTDESFRVVKESDEVEMEMYRPREARKSAICEISHRSFSQRSSMLRHKRSVHDLNNIKTICCEECFKPFRDHSFLSTHMKNVHKKEKSFNAMYAEPGLESRTPWFVI